MGFSTIGTGSGGGGGAASQVNYSVTANASQTISALYIANSIVDVAGLLVAIQNTAGSAITLTAASGAIVNTASYSDISTNTTVTIQPNQTVVLETNLANLDYFIVSNSTISNVYGGAAGQLLYQSAANVTSFVPTGPAGYMLTANGTSAPSWAPVAIPNVAGGGAGQILYQTAPNVTGFVTPGTSGQFLVSNGISMPTYATIAGGNGVTINTVGSTTSILGARAYTIGLSGQSSGVSFPSLLSGAGITDLGGNTYTLWNNTASNFTVAFGVLVNYTSWVQNGYFMNVGDLVLYPNQSVTVQTFVPSTSYTVESTTQTQSTGFASQITSMGSPPINTDTTLNFVSTFDPWGGFNNTNHSYVIPKTGLWMFQLQAGMNATGTAYTSNCQIHVNGSQKGISFMTNTSNTSSSAQQMNVFAGVFCNKGDVIDTTIWVNASGIVPTLNNNTNFSGFLCK